MALFLLLNMTASSYIESIKCLPVVAANAKLEEICGIQSFFEHVNIHSDIIPRDSSTAKDEYGDWQTNMDLTLDVCRHLKSKGVDPQVIIEPTCGKGHFIMAALQVFGSVEEIYGIEIYKPYLDELKVRILQHFIDNDSERKPRIHLYHQNIFDFDFSDIKSDLKGKEILVLGNPPWVTNSKLGVINSKNLPKKTNFKKMEGLDAITGKSNFDIAEYICHHLIEELTGEKVHVAVLLKNSVIKNILYGQNVDGLKIDEISQYKIDANKEFNVSVAASLFYCSLGNTVSKQCSVKDFYTDKDQYRYGWVDDCFVADIEAYRNCMFLDGESPLEWWSGIKHDCAKVMELSFDGNRLINGFGETVDIEDGILYPLLKSSDLRGGMVSLTRRYVIVTQSSTSDDTRWIKEKYPKAYKYLSSYADYLDNRASRIYKGRPRFCIFGIGRYSFKPYKIAVSGLYKTPSFTIVTPIDGKSVMLDDTCYMLGFDSLDDAMMTQSLLNSDSVRSFMNSIVFKDAKRVINKELLMRIDLIKAFEYYSDKSMPECQKYLDMLKAHLVPKQPSLF